MRIQSYFSHKISEGRSGRISDFRGGRDLTNASKYLFYEKKIVCLLSWLSYQNLPFLSPPVLPDTSPYHKGGREKERRSFPYGVRKDTCFAPIKQFSTNEKRPLEQEALPAIN